MAANVLFEGGAAELFNYDLGDNYIGACRDVFPKLQVNVVASDMYVNSGVIMFNVPAWLENNLSEKCVETVKKYRQLVYPDQDVLNLVCNGKIYYFDFYWNVMIGSLIQTPKNICLSEENKEAFLNCQKTPDKAKIIHYTSDRKPWKPSFCPRYGYLWLKCAEKSPFFAGKLRISYKLLVGCFLPVRTVKYPHLWNSFPYSFHNLPAWLEVSNATRSCRMKLFGHLCLYKIKCSEQKIVHLLFGFLPILCLKRM